MNFQEQMIAEWYEDCGYFVKTNVRFGRTDHGGSVGEMDVVARHLRRLELVHVESSVGSRSWTKELEEARRKFKTAEPYYEELFGPYDSLERIAVCGYARKTLNRRKKEFGQHGIRLMSVPELIRVIARRLEGRAFGRNVIPESSPILRAMQLLMDYRK